MNRSGLVAVLLVFACHRTADEYEPLDEDEFEALRVSACEATCETIDRCDPDRFAGMDPPDCYERCMTLMPRIYEENQCGSRELQWMSCLGGLDCEAFELWDYVVNLQDYYGDFECVAEFGHSTRCDPNEPFDMEENISQYP